MQETFVNNVIKNVKEDLKSMEPGSQKDVENAKIADVEKRWNELHKKVVSRNATIKKICPFAEQFNGETEKLLPWLLTADKEIRLIQPLSSETVVLIQQKRAIEVKFVVFRSYQQNFVNLKEEACGLALLLHEMESLILQRAGDIYCLWISRFVPD